MKDIILLKTWNQNEFKKFYDCSNFTDVISFGKEIHDDDDHDVVKLQDPTKKRG
jgi:hypothetical protein